MYTRLTASHRYLRFVFNGISDKSNVISSKRKRQIFKFSNVRGMDAIITILLLVKAENNIILSGLIREKDT